MPHKEPVWTKKWDILQKKWVAKHNFIQHNVPQHWDKPPQGAEKEPNKKAKYRFWMDLSSAEQNDTSFSALRIPHEFASTDL